MVKKNTIVIILKILVNFIVHQNFGNLIYDYVQKYDTLLNVEQLQKYEKTKKKIRKAELGLTFLMSWQTVNVVPKFVSFNLPNVDQYDKRCVRKGFLKRAVSKRKKELRSLKRKLSTYKVEIQNVLSPVDKFILNKAIDRNVGRQ